MRTITIEDLEIFQRVARGGGILRAAEALHRVLSNITTRIKRFEARLGQKLFRRQGRGLVLTEAGRKLLVHADALLQLADEVEADMCGGRVSGRLSLGSLESAAAAYHGRFDDIAVELKTGSTGVLLDLLYRSEIEAAFVSEPFDGAGLDGQPVFEEKLVLITGLGWPPVSTPDDLSGRALVAFPHGCSYRRRLTEWLASAGVSPPRFMDLSSYHAIIACVAAGAGAAIVPESVLALADSTGVQCHELPHEVARNHTHLVWRGAPSRSLQALISMVSGT
ncbi:LysR family transcriptional regulator [Marinobacterium weihaiense]|uniref:LysR family transcriptional regulator n=1 Tax=Marinobacterium weihaiense TaxID=2851016 RepID=A0ABS6M642_9GAMM|nr:LysR family transcriptional regulator [Marinobacterium weihaiense]MBV0931748.1 LysR family transcriptional regulator [Marinobacterium weihaiense]